MPGEICGAGAVAGFCGTGAGICGDGVAVPDDTAPAAALAAMGALTFGADVGAGRGCAGAEAAGA